MKRRKKWLNKLLILALSVLVLSGCSRVDVSDAPATLTYSPYGEDIEITLTEAETAELVRIFDGKATPFEIGTPACGFSGEVSIQIGLQRFWIAQDRCGIVFHQNSLRYFSVSDKEIEYIHQLFQKYGGKFPCV
ncbi:MAG: hypothetical protein IJE00_07835 [Clostridia bacterium]|nr:hypothetical protein [Clostridia bacterium]MBQ2940261.1 hypothetical protein [Clostridia bacterium]